MENESIVTRVSRIWLGEDGIIRVIHFPGAKLTLENAKDSMAAYQKLNKGKRRPIFIDIKTLKDFSREARQYFAGEYAAKASLAAAIIVGSPVSRVLGNFYLGISNPILPTRIFSSEDEALEWLKGYIE